MPSSSTPPTLLALPRSSSRRCAAHSLAAVLNDSKNPSGSPWRHTVVIISCGQHVC